MSEDIVQDLIMRTKVLALKIQNVLKDNKKIMNKKGIKTCQTHPSFDTMEEGRGSLGMLFRI